MNRIWHDSSALERTSQIYLLVYHELKAHVHLLVSRPSEAVFYKRFQVGRCACFFYLSLTCQDVGFIWMLVLTLGFLLLTGDEPGHRLGAFQIVCQMVDLIGAELTCASDVGQLDARFQAYHYDLREYVRLGGACNVDVSRVIR